MPLAALLGMSATTQQHAVADRGLAPVSSIPSVLEMPVPQMGAKCQHHSSDQGVPALRQEEGKLQTLTTHPKSILTINERERLATKALKEPH